MKKLVVLVFVSLIATSAFATIDPDANSVGIYFDGVIADQVSGTLTAFDRVEVYIVVTSHANAISGLRFRWLLDMDPALTSEISQLNDPAAMYGPGAVPVGTGTFLDGEVAVGWADPLPSVDGNTIAVTRKFFTFVDIGVDFYLRPADGQDAITYTWDDGLGKTIFEDPLGTLSGDPMLPVALANGGYLYTGVVATESASFGSVKSLFR